MKRLANCNPVTATAVAGLVSAVLVGTVCMIWNVYALRSDAGWVRALGGWMPAARVGSQVVPYGRFLKSRAALRVYLGSPLAKGEGLDPALTPSLEKAALDRLMRELVVGELAKARGIEVPDKDVEDSFASIVAATSNTIPDASKYLQETFGWTQEEYRWNVMRPAIIEERLAASMTSDTQAQFMELQKAVGERMAEKDVLMYLNFGPIPQAPAQDAELQ